MYKDKQICEETNIEIDVRSWILGHQELASLTTMWSREACEFDGRQTLAVIILLELGRPRSSGEISLCSASEYKSYKL